MLRRRRTSFPLLFGGSKVPYLIFNGTSTFSDHGSDASLDNLFQAGDVTVDGWINPTAKVDQNTIFSKGGYVAVAAGGMLFTAIDPADGIVGRVYNDALNVVQATNTASVAVGWHHVVFFWDNSERKLRLATDGSWGSLTAALTVGNITDAVRNFYLGTRTNNGWWYKGSLGWFRVSNNDRFGGAAGTSFTPPSRKIYPSDDVNRVEQWNINEGSGSTLTALETTPGNNGSITDGAWGRG